MKLKILCIGDVVGRPGRRILADKLLLLIKEREIDCVIANAENAAGGSGLTPQIYDKLLKYGVNLITLGDHSFRKREVIEVLEKQSDIVRPANMSEYAAGRGYAFYKTSKGPVVAVVCLMGRVFMKMADSPFSAIDKILPKLERECDIIIVDFHAEATSEKIAMAYYLDGKISCLFGTHTHVSTADEKIFPHGMAYITDVGMTGPHDSILGRKHENVLKTFRTQMPYPFEIATGDIQINALEVVIDSNTKRAESVQRLRVCEKYEEAASYDSDDGRPEYMNNGF